LLAGSLENKVAIVTECSTGLGQGMAVGLANVGCNMVGVGTRKPTETQKKWKPPGENFLRLEPI